MLDIGAGPPARPSEEASGFIFWQGRRRRDALNQHNERTSLYRGPRPEGFGALAVWHDPDAGLALAS